MDDIRKSMIEEMMLTLKIPQGNFNFGTIADGIKHIPNQNLREFYKSVMVSESFGNGMKAIISVANLYKPKGLDVENEIEKKAKILITGVEQMNSVLFDVCVKSGDNFEEYIRGFEFDNVSEESKHILNAVPPFNNLSNLVLGIRTYQTSLDTLNAFKRAIKFSETKLENGNMLMSVKNNLQIKKF